MRRNPKAEPVIKYKFLGAPYEEKVKALTVVWEKGLQLSELAARLSYLTGRPVTRISMKSVFQDHPDLRVKFPIAGRLRSKKGLKPSDPPSKMLTPGVDRTKADATSKKKTMLDLEPRECRWPTHFEDGRHRFCARPTAFGFEYCEKHYYRQFQPNANPTPYGKQTKEK